MVVAGCLVEKQLKKSKDSSLPIEMSGTLPMPFTDKSELLTSANNMEMTETDTVGKKVKKKKKKKTLLTLCDGASPLSFADRPELFLSTDNTETTAAGTNGKTFKKKKSLLTFGDGMSPQSFTVRPEVFSETAEMDITKKGVKKKKKTHVQTSKLMFGDDPAPLVTDAFKGQKEQTSGQKTKKRKLNKEMPKQDDEEKDLPEQVLEVLNESELEKVKKKKKHRQESENQEPTAEVSELSEPETKKRKKKHHKDSRSTVMVLPTEHLTETSLDENSVTVEHDTETSVLEASTAVGGRQKAKKKRAKQHLHPPEPAATPVLAQMEEQENKRRTEQLHDSPKLGEVEMEGQKKKRKKRRAEQLPDCPAPAATPVLREVEMEKQKKKKHRQENESQEPTAEVSELIEPEQKKKKKKKHKDSRSTVMVLPTEHLTETSLDGNPVTVEHDTETSGLEASTAVGGRQKAKKKRAKQNLHPPEPAATPVLGQMDGQKERKKKKKRTEQLLDSPVLGEMEGEKKRKRTEKIPDCLVLGQVAMTGQKKKKRRTEQLTGSAMLGEVELKGQKKRKKKQLPDSQAKVLGATAKERQKKKKKKRQNGENVVMEVETPKSKKKKHDGGTQVADERMSERQTDAVENYVEELEEFVPDVRSKSLRQIYKLIKYDLGRFKAFKSQGIPLRSGRFSEEENKRLTKNVSDFLALSGIKHANQAFHPQRFKDLYMHLKRLRSQYKFHERLAEGIPRPWHMVYQRGRRMFDENNHKGRFSEEELHQLKKFQTLHGNDWKKISLVMGRSDLSLEKRFSQLASNKGVWSVEETSRLMDAMREHLRGLTEPAGENQMNGEVIRKEKLYKDLPWTDVSYNVQTRSWTQCKNKWMSLLKEKMAPGRQAASINRGIKCKSTQAKINLIERMYEMQVEDAADIDWDKVTESMGNVPPYYIQKQFNRLKVSKVPLWEQMTYCDIVDFLYKVVLPEFREYLTKAPLTENSLEQMPDPKEYFLLSDIFSEECEVDNVN